jgi:5-methylcytosine-specific restriction endonuclease McrA
MEVVKFDMQQLDNAEISGVEYQQGTLFGYELREYLLSKWGRQCAYCGAKDVPLEIEHINPRSRSHDDRGCNLTLSCKPCNSDDSLRLKPGASTDLHRWCVIPHASWLSPFSQRGGMRCSAQANGTLI